MPASEPRKEQLADAIVTALRAVSTGADYWTDLGRNVSRRRYMVEAVDSLNLPCASVWTGHAKPSPNQVTGRYRERVQVLVELWVRTDRLEHLDRDTIRCEADVKQAVLTTLDLGLSGVVVEVSPAEVQADHHEFDDRNLGYRVVAFEVDYQWTASTP